VLDQLAADLRREEIAAARSATANQ